MQELFFDCQILEGLIVPRKTLNRREFISKTGALSIAAASSPLLAPVSRAATTAGKPNILVIITDHTLWKSLGAYGNTWAQTPNIDVLAREGVRFEYAYTPVPLCQPARASFWTSRYPHETNVRSNESSEKIPENMPTLGELFSNAGYNCYHAGKTHDAGSLRGFTKAPVGESPAPEDAWSFIYNYDTKQDEYAIPRMLDFIRGEHDRPFLAVLDLNNPHNISNYVGQNQRNGSTPNRPELTDEQLPPLPDNFEIEDWEKLPLPVQYLCCTHRRLRQGAEWDPRNYRHYMAAFDHFQTMADTKVGLVVQALEDAGQLDNTLIVYMADHGDGYASHRMITKHLSFYEESTRVPFIFRGPNVLSGDISIDNSLISTLDLLPTLCEYAGIPAPDGIRGKSVLKHLQGETPEMQHDYVVSQWHKEYNHVNFDSQLTREGRATSPGRMIRTDGFKYMRWIEGGGEELYDMANDPGEKHNVIADPAYADVARAHRDLLQTYVNDSGDDFFTLEVNVDPEFRGSHEPGYPNHYEARGS